MSGPKNTTDESMGRRAATYAQLAELPTRCVASYAELVPRRRPSFLSFPKVNPQRQEATVPRRHHCFAYSYTPFTSRLK